MPFCNRWQTRPSYLFSIFIFSVNSWSNMSNGSSYRKLASNNKLSKQQLISKWKFVLFASNYKLYETNLVLVRHNTRQLFPGLLPLKHWTGPTVSSGTTESLVILKKNEDKAVFHIISKTIMQSYSSLFLKYLLLICSPIQ